MHITDFKFDNIYLSSFGFIVCDFNTSSQNTISNGSNIDFTTVSINHGKHFALANAKYSEALTATFSICKNPCVSNYSPALTVAEISQLSSWLNRRNFCELWVDAEGYEDLYFYGSFNNIQRVEFGGDVIGLTFDFISNAPFAYKSPITETLVFESSGETKTINVVTDELGEFYPFYVEVTCNSDGDLHLYNDDWWNNCSVKNCSENETLYFEYPTIDTSADHNLANDFNYNFLQLVKNNNSPYQANHIHTTLPCEMIIKYRPICKIGL